ncbi:MAG: hypothetical protein K2X77_23675 [Candidatus Obscuribacterales bacterium]|nr:hypothetical protein [Candidatus Obscuribacterales bacterium]
MIQKAKALSYQAMADLVQNRADLLSCNSFVCIAQPHLFGPQTTGWPEDSERWLNVFFEDVRPEHMSMIHELEAQFGRAIRVFNEELADKIIEFLLQCNERKDSEALFVNCAAGVSRSGAIATFAAEIFELDRKQFQKDNPGIAPNGLVLYLLRERWNLRTRPHQSKIPAHSHSNIS